MSYPRGSYSLRILRQGCLCLAALVWLAGCGRFGAEPEPPPVAETPPESAQAAVPVPAPAQTVPPIARRTVDDDVRQLLQDAETALVADQLTSPIHDNAFDRFQAVLLLRPDNQQAKTGLQQIFTRYVGMVREALRRGEPETARVLLERARLVNRDHPILEELAGEIRTEQKRLAERTEPTGNGSDTEIPLSVQHLDRRDQRVIAQLQALAARVKEAEASLLIVARNDAEGRWIYQQMSEGVPDYRLRGDIRVGSQPKILLLPPIE